MQRIESVFSLFHRNTTVPKGSVTLEVLNIRYLQYLQDQADVFNLLFEDKWLESLLDESVPEVIQNELSLLHFCLLQTQRLEGSSGFWDTVDTDMPWNFEEIRQRVGRGARQGNTVAKLRNVYLLMRGSFDTLTYTIMSGKKSWLSQLWDSEIDELGNSGQGFSGEEMALLMSDDVSMSRRVP